MKLSVCPSVCFPSVCPIIRPLAGLMLRFRCVGDIDRLLHGQRAAATASSVTLGVVDCCVTVVSAP